MCFTADSTGFLSSFGIYTVYTRGPPYDAAIFNGIGMCLSTIYMHFCYIIECNFFIMENNREKEREKVAPIDGMMHTMHVLPENRIFPCICASIQRKCAAAVEVERAKHLNGDHIEFAAHTRALAHLLNQLIYALTVAFGNETLIYGHHFSLNRTQTKFSILINTIPSVRIYYFCCMLTSAMATMACDGKFECALVLRLRIKCKMRNHSCSSDFKI